MKRDAVFVFLFKYFSNLFKTQEKSNGYWEEVWSEDCDCFLHFAVELKQNGGSIIFGYRILNSDRT